MSHEELIRQIEQLLAALRAGDDTAAGRLIALGADYGIGQIITADRFEIGNIERSQAVAIGRGARSFVFQQSDMPPEVVDRLLAVADLLLMQGVKAPTPLPDDIPRVVEGEADYVFLSYARPDRPIAVAVETYLEQSGFRVFCDTSVLPGSNWDMMIEKALHEAGRMVLLLSDHSMPFRKEVHREWFFFDQNNKPIHPLYLRKCELHSRLYSYHYLQVGNDLYGALKTLVNDLSRPFELVPKLGSRDRIVVNEAAGQRPLPEAMAELLKAVKGEEGYAALTLKQIKEIVQHSPTELVTYRLGRIAEWSLPRYQLDDRFVTLTLLIDQGEEAHQRWAASESARRFNDLRSVIQELSDNPALVLLGAPGSGKSTLLRRLQLDDAIDLIRENDTQRVSFFISLNAYRPASPGAPLPAPHDWLVSKWADRYPNLPSLDDLLAQGRVLLLLDALNEMPHRNAQEYAESVDLWRQFIVEYVGNWRGNRAVFSCRSLDYSTDLSSRELRVPQVVVQPMSPDQVQQFLRVYIPAQAGVIWAELEGSPQFDLFCTPYFLKLLVDLVEAVGEVPQGRAALFTGFVREMLRREIEVNPLLVPNGLFTRRDSLRLTRDRWRSPFDLPERGLLIPSLSDLAFEMQETSDAKTEGAQVRIDYDDACDLLPSEYDEEILQAGVDLSVLDEDEIDGEVLFFHQLLQEFFAARRLAKHPDPELVRVEWRADRVSPSLEQALAKLANSNPLLPLPSTGWEGTTVLAAIMAEKPALLIKALMDVNLPLAARCAANPEVTLDSSLKREIQQQLIARTQNPEADLRARIAAGEALGDLGDPRLARRTGPHGDYLLPPFVDIPAGEYPIGSDEGLYNEEAPAHTVPLAAFQIGQFPVTNAEYALFIAAGGYEDERWWDTEAARAWRRGEGTDEDPKRQWCAFYENKEEILKTGQIGQWLEQGNITSKQAEDWETLLRCSDEEFEAWLDENFPGGRYTQPAFWDDSTFNNPAQPVVGVCWYEARAYCCWLAAQTGMDIRLPTEAQREAVTRGLEGRQYAYPGDYDPAMCNTYETHIRRTTPVGVFPGGETPEGAVDLTGNVWDWTTSIYDQERFPYPYRADDGRDEPEAVDDDGHPARRVLRGGAWDRTRGRARAAYRTWDEPSFRASNTDGGCGFRLVMCQCH